MRYGDAVSIAADVRTWIDEQPAQTFFYADEIPGWSPAARSLMTRIAADPEHPVVRVARGFYCKRWHQDWAVEDRCKIADEVLGGLCYAGIGGGMADWQALNKVGWTNQVPCVHHFCCVGRPPTTPWPHTRFVQRNNERRTELTWAEVTLLEALRMFRRADIGWDKATELVVSGTYLGRLRYGAEVDRDRFVWGAAGELRQPAEFHDRVMSLAAVMPAHDSWDAWYVRFASVNAGRPVV